MVDEWERRRLADCADWYSGGTPSKSNPSYWSGTIPWISAKSLTQFFVDDSDDRVTEMGARNGTRVVPENTVLFVVRGMSLKTEFRMGIATRPVTFNQDLKALVAVNGVLPRFLAYAIKARSSEILNLVGEAGHGTGVLPTDRIQGLEIQVPPLGEQQAIANILGALDDKIELNRKMNETLEAMARALFQSWFVDFEPVRAKAEGRDPGLPTHLADLFPSSFVASELGEIPDLWQRRKLGELVELKRGYDLPKSAREIGDFPIVSSSGVSGTHSSAKCHGPGVVTGRYGTLGAVYYIDGDFWPLNTALYVSNFGENPGLYIYHLLQIVEFSQFSDKGAVPGINRNHLHEWSCVDPPLVLKQEFQHFAEPIWGRKSVIEVENTTLAELRDTLLPKLISGELRVKDAERAVECVV